MTTEVTAADLAEQPVTDLEHPDNPVQVLVRKAIADPGRFVNRLGINTDGWSPEMESLSSWAARAVVVALALGEHLPAREARWGVRYPKGTSWHDNDEPMARLEARQVGGELVRVYTYRTSPERVIEVRSHG